MKEIINSVTENIDLEEKAVLLAGMSKQDRIDLLERLKAVRSEGAGRFLNMIYTSETDKEVRKLIKKLLFRLKTLGIQVEEPEAGGEPALRKIEEARDHKGFMSNYDAEGIRVVLAAFEVRKNNFILFHGISHFSEGLLELSSGPIERQTLETIIRQYRGETKKAFFYAHISPKYAAYLIEEASGYSAKYLEEIKQIQRLATRVMATVQHPNDIYRLNIAETTVAQSVENILNHALLESFVLTWNTLDQDRKVFEDISNPSIILPSYMTEEKKRTFLTGLIEGNELKTKLHLVKRMMEDYAYILYSLGDFALYKGLIDQLREKDGVKNMLIFLVTKSLQKTIEKPSGILVKPYG